MLLSKALLSAVLLACCCFSLPAIAQQPAPATPAASATSAAPAAQPKAHFDQGTQALSAGRFDEAIDYLEAHADRAPSHPDASYNRGLAYIMRVRNGAERPGDLGRAAAAFEETLAMRSGDRDAAHALSLIQAEVARRRSRAGRQSVIARPTLDRVIVQLTSERIWGICAVVAAWMLTLGLLLRWRTGAYRVAGRLLVPLGLVALVVLLPIYSWARHLRTTTRPGVVVVRESFLSDDEGNRQTGDPIPEAAAVEVGQREGRRVYVRYGSREGWVAADNIRLLRVR